MTFGMTLASIDDLCDIRLIVFVLRWSRNLAWMNDGRRQSRDWRLSKHQLLEIFHELIPMIGITEIFVINIWSIFKPDKSMNMTRPSVLPFKSIPKISMFHIMTFANCIEEKLDSSL